MPVSDEERNKYIAFVGEQIKRLKSLEVDSQQLIWHYTTGDALLSIVRSGTIYATQVACLNDSSEVRYGEDLLKQAFLHIQTKESLPLEEASFLEQVLKPSAGDGTTNPTSDWFVSCFSKEKDDLSQWRAYSGGENGYAIGFIVGAFFRPHNLVVRVNYDEDEHRATAQTIAEATLQFYREGLQTRSGKEAKSWPTEFLQEWSIWTGKLAPMVKDPAFHGEKEYRIIHQYQGFELSKLSFRQKQSLMSLHLPLVFPPPEWAIQSNRLPIMEVMVGPSRHKDISRVSAELFMRQNGYSNVSVTISKAPFQTT